MAYDGSADKVTVQQRKRQSHDLITYELKVPTHNIYIAPLEQFSQNTSHT